MNGHAKQRRMRNMVQSNDNVIDLLPDVTVRNGDGVLHGGDNDLDTDPLMSPDELLKIDNDVICNSGGSDDTVYRTYKRRWYVLFLYTMLNLILGVLNNTWSGCEISAMVAFGWSKRNMAVLVNWAPIMNFLSTFACCWLFTKKGLRVGMVVSCALLTIGTGLRCITSSTPYVTWLVQIGQALIGLGTPTIFASPTYLSATWFPLEERLTATALSQVGIFIGATLPNIIIPFTIDEPSSQNVTNASAIFRHEATIIGNQILDTMYAQFGVTAFLSLLVVVYFPAKPPTPVREPSLDDSFNFFGELKKLFCCRIIWCFAVSYGLLYGTYWSWQNSNDIIFVDLNYTQYEFNTVSIWSSVAFLFSQFGFAFAMPLIGTRMKTVIIGFYAGSAFFVFWLILSLLKVFPAFYRSQPGPPLHPIGCLYDVSCDAHI